MGREFTIEWSPGTASRCTRCGGYGIDQLEDGRARCNNCGLTAIPTAPDRYSGMRRAVLILVSIPAGIVAVELTLSGLLSGGSFSSFRADAGLSLFWTGVALFMVAGAFAAFGSLPLRTIGGVSLRDESRRKSESLAKFAPVVVIALFGLSLLALGLLFGV